MFRISGYKIMEKIYEGSKNVIYKAYQNKYIRPVILKMPSTEHPDLSIVEMLKYEFQMNSKINSNKVVKIFEIDQINNMPVLIMEDFKGVSLRNIMDIKKMNTFEFLHYALKITEALGDIHSSNIIHNDINPRNIIVNVETDEVKITDFGISKLYSKDNLVEDNSCKIKGTLHYVAPEQTGRVNCPIDFRTDLYSLGATLYELSVGKVPFEAEDELGLIHCHIAKKPIAPSVINKDIPENISKIIMKLMEKMVANRYQTAKGLEFDLKRCIDEYKVNGYISDFALGEKDISDRFQIPAKMYGRKDQVLSLTESFNRIKSGKKEMVMISGEPGIGKSVFVNEVKKNISRESEKVYFISGKCDYLKRDIPYYSIGSAFNNLVKELLSESRDEVEIWSEKLLSEVGPNIRLLIDFIPELEKLVDKKTDSIDLPLEEARNRFNLVFQKFINVVCTKEHPLILFLDDLQWADLSTIKLIEIILLDKDIKYIMFIAGFRNNKADESKVFVKTIHSIMESKIKVNSIVLGPLNISNITELLSDTLFCEPSDVEPLAEICKKKTEGNPFFLNQFLLSLYKENLICFNREQNKWQWDLYGVQNSVVTENVVELISSRIKKFPITVQEVLKVAACIGNDFDLIILSRILGESTKEVYDKLWEALKEDLIFLQGDIISFVEGVEGANLYYSFAHERIQQAAYNLFDEEHREKIHHEIGRLMLQHIDKDYNDDSILTIVNQFNLGIALVVSEEEKKEIANLEFLAGKRAKKANAYEEAFTFLKTGIGLISEFDIEENYDLAMNLYMEAAEVGALVGDFVAVYNYSKEVLNKSRSTLEKVNAYQSRISSFWAQNMINDAVDTALIALKLLGIKFPKNPTKTDVMMSLFKIKLLLMGKNNKELLNLPSMKNPKMIAAERIFIKVSLPALKSSPVLFLLMILKSFELCIRYGNPDGAHTFYNGYGMVLSIIGDIEKGYDFGRLSLEMMDKQAVLESNAQTIASFNSYISFLKLHIKETNKMFLEAHSLGLETGNIDFACTSASMYCIYSYYEGKELNALLGDLNKYTSIIKKSKNREAVITQYIYSQTVLNLLGENENPCYLVGKVYDENEKLPIQIKSNDKLTVCYAYLNKMILSYLFCEYEMATGNAILTEKYLDGARGTLTTQIYYFYDSLILLAEPHKYSKSKQKKYIKKVEQNQNKMKKWAKYAPSNFLHKYYLVEAEKERVLENDLKAIEYYRKAIELASENEYLQEEALANELAAKFYFSRDNLKVAKMYMEEAYYLYKLWGANAKVKQLEKEYFMYLNDGIDRKKNKSTSYITTDSKTTSISGTLEISSILKATQAISGEIILDELFKKLVYILLESAGAQKVSYLAKKDGKYLIQVAGSEEQKRIAVIKGGTLEIRNSLPKKIIFNVDRFKESIILDNASISDDYMNDPYIIRTHAKSILCMPVINKNEIIGILYLENNLIEGAFSLERVEILKVVASQLAISLENANLYNNLEELVEERTQELKEEIIERKKIEKQLEEMATRDTLTGLANRKLFQDRLKHSLEIAKRNKKILCVLFIDLDGFKSVNDSLGHDSGDMVLKIISERFLKSVRSCDMVSRLGGDEFTIIIDEVEDMDGISIICKRIIEEVGQEIFIGDKKIFVTASIGVSIYPDDSDDMLKLIKKADDAMYIAKKTGKNQFVFSN